MGVSLLARRTAFACSRQARDLADGLDGATLGLRCRGVCATQLRIRRIGPRFPCFLPWLPLANGVQPVHGLRGTFRTWRADLSYVTGDEQR